MNANRYYQNQYTRRKKRKSSAFTNTVIIAVILLIGFFSVSFLSIHTSLFNIKTLAKTTNPVNKTNWELVLVNPTHKIPDNYMPELTTLANGNQVDSRIYPSLQEMFDDARAQGVYPNVGSGYRSKELQQYLYDAEIATYQAQGNDYENAEAIAKKWVAFPGTSEHQTGLAVDIYAAQASGQDDETVHEWLAENAYKYGFILRYPEDKIDITNINYEPWHYRYVGTKAAKEIHDKGICLEEYLK